MKAFEQNTTGSNQNRLEGLVQMQLSYSTADIEKSIFFGAEGPASQPVEPLGTATILVVHGEMFQLEEGSIPQPAVPLTEHSGLFRLPARADQPQQ